MNSSNINVTQDNDGWPIEKQEWLEALFARDVNGVMQRRMDQAVDGDYQMYSVLPGE